LTTIDVSQPGAACHDRYIRKSAFKIGHWNSASTSESLLEGF